MAREKEIQRLLVEAGETYEKLRGEVEGVNGSNGVSNGGIIVGGEGAGRMEDDVGGYLSNVDGTASDSDSDTSRVRVAVRQSEPTNTTRKLEENNNDENEEDDEDERPAFGLGIPAGGGGAMRSGLGWS